MVRPIRARPVRPRAHGARAAARAAATAAACALVTTATAGCGSGDADVEAATAPTPSSQPPGQAAPTFELRDAATEPVRSEGAGGPSRLVDARVVPQEGFDRVVFELVGDRPTVEVAYLGDPPATSSDGTDVPADAAVLSVRLSPVQDRLVIDGQEVPTYRGPGRISGDGTPVEALVRSESAEDSVAWQIVLDEQRPFLVDTLDDPNRVIIDVADR